MRWKKESTACCPSAWSCILNMMCFFFCAFLGSILFVYICMLLYFLYVYSKRGLCCIMILQTEHKHNSANLWETWLATASSDFHIIWASPNLLARSFANSIERYWNSIIIKVTQVFLCLPFLIIPKKRCHPFIINYVVSYDVSITV